MIIKIVLQILLSTINNEMQPKVNVILDNVTLGRVNSTKFLSVIKASSKKPSRISFWLRTALPTQILMPYLSFLDKLLLTYAYTHIYITEILYIMLYSLFMIYNFIVTAFYDLKDLLKNPWWLILVKYGLKYFFFLRSGLYFKNQ